MNDQVLGATSLYCENGFSDRRAVSKVPNMDIQGEAPLSKEFRHRTHSKYIDEGKTLLGRIRSGLDIERGWSIQYRGHVINLDIKSQEDLRNKIPVIFKLSHDDPPEPEIVENSDDVLHFSEAKLNLTRIVPCMQAFMDRPSVDNGLELSDAIEAEILNDGWAVMPFQDEPTVKIEPERKWAAIYYEDLPNFESIKSLEYPLDLAFVLAQARKHIETNVQMHYAHNAQAICPSLPIFLTESTYS